MDESFNNSFFSKLAYIFNKYENVDDLSEEGIDLSNRSVNEIVQEIEPKKVQIPIQPRKKRQRVICDLKGWSFNRNKPTNLSNTNKEEKLQENEKIESENHNKESGTMDFTYSKNSYENNNPKLKKYRESITFTKNKSKNEMEEKGKSSKYSNLQNSKSVKITNKAHKKTNFVLNEKNKSTKKDDFSSEIKELDSSSIESDSDSESISYSESYSESEDLYDKYSIIFRARKKKDFTPEIIYENGFDDIFKNNCSIESEFDKIYKMIDDE